MENSIFDAMADAAIQTSAFSSGLELHSFLMGILLPYVCLGIAIFDKRVAGIVFGICVLSGYGLIPFAPTATVIEQKPWYFIIGSCSSSIFVYLVTIRKSLWMRLFFTG